jgi:uncharacterized phage protein gp47/JayE
MAYVPPNVGPAGLSISNYLDIMDDDLAGFLATFGANQYVGKDSAIYQFVSILSLKISDLHALAQYVYNQFGAMTAVGAGQDRLYKLNGIARLAYTFSTCTVTLTANGPLVITNGAVQDASGFTWLLPSPVVFLAAGTQDVTATCTAPGNITAEPGELSVIATPINGWTAATNAAAAVPGNPVETDSRFRARQSISTAVPSKTMLAGTRADIAGLAGVTRLNVLENFTSAVDIYGNPGHSLTCVVEGGVQEAIAEAIYFNRGIGCNPNGLVNGVATAQTVVVTIVDPVSGWPTPISFLLPVYVPIYVTMTIHGLAGFTSATLAAIQAAVVDYLNSLQIGEAVVFSELYGAALTARPDPDAPTFSIRSVFSDVVPAPAAVLDIPLLFNQVAQGVTPNVIVTSV